MTKKTTHNWNRKTESVRRSTFIGILSELVVMAKIKTQISNLIYRVEFTI
jgi:hypothetical protein